MSSLCSHITVSESDSSSCSSSPSSRSSSSFSDITTSDLSPPTSSTILKASSSAGIQLNVTLGRPTNSATSRDDKENFQVVVLKVVPVVTNTRTYQGSRFWVAVAVGDSISQVGIGEHVGRTETIATKKAEKKAFRGIKRIELFEQRTLKTRVTGWSGGECLTISPAPRGTGVVSTSGMTRKVLQLAGVKDCSVKNAWDKLTTVRALAKALSKFSTTNRK